MALWTAILIHLIFGMAGASNLCKRKQGTLSDSCSDEGSSFLQHSGTAVSPKRVQAHQQGNGSLTAIKAIDCRFHDRPLQVMRSDAGFAVTELDITNGSYEELYVIPWTTGGRGGYSDLNACSINPKDSILYCVMFANAPYIVRIDSTPNVEFVARLPWGDYISGAFAPDSERFYISPWNAEFLIIEGLSEKMSYADKTQAEDMRGIGPRLKKPAGWYFTADCVVLNQDLEGNGDEEYIISLYGPKLQIAKYEPSTKTFGQSWVINVKPARWDNIYGAGWTFQNTVFFASNRGNGVYRVQMRNFSLRQADQFDDPYYVMQLERQGPSNAATVNDGMTCMHNKSPWILPMDCTDYPGPMQAFWREDHYDVDKLNVTTGEYTTIYKVKNETTLQFLVLNGWGINPADSIVYACMVVDEWDAEIESTPPPFYIVRIDDTKVRFIAKVQAPHGSPISGAFAPDGTYYVVSNPSFLWFEDLSKLRSFEHRDDERLPVYDVEVDLVNTKNMSSRSARPAAGVGGTSGRRLCCSGWKIPGAAQISDIAVVEADLGDGSGTTTWVMSANTASQLVLMNAAAGTYHVIPINSLVNGSALRAAWSFENEVYFASNDGAGVFRVPMSEVRHPFTDAVTLVRVGPSDPAHDNDGMSCSVNPSPW